MPDPSTDAATLPADVWHVAGRDLLARRATVSGSTRPLLMGILNVTPDSFSDGGRFGTLAAAVDQAEALVAAGADVIDIGGESTRPGADPVDAKEELRRTQPVVEALAGRLAVPLSIDTTKAVVAEAALQSGATIVNDISGLTFDARMPGVCAASDCGVVAMHIAGTPQTMQDDPQYDNVVAEVDAWLAARLRDLEAAGIDSARVMLDPGIGFGKTAAHNVQLLRSVRTLQRRRPLLIGHSRKRFLKAVLGREVEERLAGTIGVAVAMAARGVAMLRIHDVQAVGDAITAYQAVLGDD